jgi:hypothetical protein
MTGPAQLLTGLCGNCFTYGAQRLLIIGQKAPQEPGWPAVAAELCGRCTQAGLMLSAVPGALHPLPWGRCQ